MRKLLACIFMSLVLSGCGRFGAGRGEAAPAEPCVADLDRAESVDPGASPEDHAIEQETASAGPVRGSGRIPRGTARITREGFPGDEGAKDDWHASLAAAGARIVLRRREAGQGASSSFYVRAQMPRGGACIHAGSLVPDFACGLLAGGSHSPHVFSSSFPIDEPRWIAANTSFFGRALLGGAGEIRLGSVRAAVFAGRERYVRSGRFSLSPEPIAGGRLEAPLGALIAGISATKGPGGETRPRFGADVRMEAGEVRAVLEAACSVGRGAAALAAVSYRRAKTRLGALSYSVPAGVAGPFGRINGRDLGPAASYSGTTIAAERKLAGRVAVRAAGERSLWTGDSRQAERCSLKGELEGRWRRVRLRLSWASSLVNESALVPVPARASPSREESRSTGVLVTLIPAGSCSIRLAAKSVAESGRNRGLLLSPMLRAGSPRSRIRVTAFHAAYLASGGASACYYYEPVLAAAYPWRCAYRSTARGGIIFVFKIKKIEVSCKIVLERGRGPHGIAQAAAAL